MSLPDFAALALGVSWYYNWDCRPHEHGRMGGLQFIPSRVFGSFISWMQEKTAPVFVVATANDVSLLPPGMHPLKRTATAE